MVATAWARFDMGGSGFLAVEAAARRGIASNSTLANRMGFLTAVQLFQLELEFETERVLSFFAGAIASPRLPNARFLLLGLVLLRDSIASHRWIMASFSSRSFSIS